MLAHSRRLDSVPSQLSSSKKMGPLPSPKQAPLITFMSGGSSTTVNQCKTYQCLILHARQLEVEVLPLYGSPSWLQTTSASSELKAFSQTVPQALLTQISTLPSRELVPFANLSSPSVQFPKVVVASSNGTDKVKRIC